jgi:hypothetical protein
MAMVGMPWHCWGGSGASLHGSIVGAGGGQWACCSVGRVVAGHQWWDGMTEAAGATLHCWGSSGIDGACRQWWAGLAGVAFPG